MKLSLKNCFILLVIVALLVGCASSGNQQQLSGRAKTSYRSARDDMGRGLHSRALQNFLEVLEFTPDHVESAWSVASLYFSLAEDAFGEDVRRLFESSYVYFVRTIDTIDGIEDWQSYDKFEFWRDDSELMLERIFARLFLIGQECYQNEDFDTARDIFNELLILYPDRIESVTMLAAIANTLGDTERAMGYFLRILENDPTNTLVMINLAIEYQALEDFANAIKYLLMLLEHEPENISGYQNLAYIHLQMQNHEEALQVYERALEIAPDNVDVLSDAYNVAFTLNNDEKVIYFLKRLVVFEKSDNTLRNLVIYLARSQDWENVLDYAKQWHEFDPELREALEFILYAARQLNDEGVSREYQEIMNRLD
ncbi:MAG: tetratricopeptide repeat protein [Candidatus Cloacimonetes bacterium]|nr:tetratricopeptide repeat protein [Candidatus Cloacimonadota bacterium]